MALKIDDGYTLNGKTSGQNVDGSPIDVIKFEYRPPRAIEMQEYRFKMQAATSGEEQHKTRCAFIAARLVSWDVTARDGKPVPPAPDWIDKLPDPYILDLVSESSKWKPRQQESAGGN